MSIGVVDYGLTRDSAAKMLRVSVRTVDRYVKSGKLSSRQVDGRVYLDAAEVTTFRALGRRSGASQYSSGLSTYVDKPPVVKKSYSSSVKPSSGGHVDSQYLSTSQPVVRQSVQSASPDKFNFQKNIEENQKKLEEANYRIGKLEAELKNSIPMLRYEMERLEDLRKRQKMEEDFREAVDLIQKLKKKLIHESVSKKIFILILLVALALQPLWLLTR